MEQSTEEGELDSMEWGNGDFIIHADEDEWIQMDKESCVSVSDWQ